MQHYKPYIIGITGGSGSGKTTLIKHLANTFPRQEVCIISQDDYYRPHGEQLVDAHGVTNYDLPRSIDDEAFLNDVERLMAGDVVERQEYTFNNALATPKMLTFVPAPIILVEGIFVFYFSKIEALFDLRIFVEAHENIKVIRRIKRDGIERNLPLEDVLYRYEHHVMPAFEQYIKPYMRKADIVVNNDNHFHASLEVLSAFIRQKVADSKK
jgi:uridine kinase